jgi:hypothetical protein
MPTINDIHRVVTDLHEKRILNADTTINELLSVKGDQLTNPGALAGWYAVGGDHYVIICGKNPVGAVINPGEAQSDRNG